MSNRDQNYSCSTSNQEPDFSSLEFKTGKGFQDYAPRWNQKIQLTNYWPFEERKAFHHSDHLFSNQESLFHISFTSWSYLKNEEKTGCVGS